MMDGKDLYMLACRFPEEVIPNGLRAMAPKVSYYENHGWVGEYWYYISGSAVPRMYAKLHLPEGQVLEINKLTGETLFFGSSFPKEPDRQWLEYLDCCVRVIETTDTTEKERNQLTVQWIKLLTAKEKMWFRIQPPAGGTERKQASAPPQWLTEYWTAQRVHSVLKTGSEANVDHWILTENDPKRMYLGKVFSAVEACIPPGLTPGLPRLSYTDSLGWTAEYRYYYAKPGIGFWLFPEPRYFLKICLKTGQLLEVKNLTNQLQFRQYRSDACTLWENEQELDYLGQCETLMRKATPTDTEVAQLEGLWLEAHPKNHAVWLANHACIREDTVRWLLSPNRIPNRNILLPLWFGEMVKGMTLGAPDVVEWCAGELAEFERYTAL